MITTAKKVWRRTPLAKQVQSNKIGLEALRCANPWPDISGLEGQPSYMWSLDGGGRHLVTDLIKEVRPKTFLEIGTFLGGSALQWLESAPDFTLIVVDAWSKKVADMEKFTQRQIDHPPAWVQDIDLLRRLVQPLAEHGIFKVAMHNLRRYRARVIPIVMTTKKAYAYVSEFIEPDIIYIDANKEKQDYHLAHETFPATRICGDDWYWEDARGEFTVRRYVNEVASLRNCHVVAEGATWVLTPKT
jgi:hypothetical protein